MEIDRFRLEAIVAEIEERIAREEALLKEHGSYAGYAEVKAYKACLRLLNGTNTDEETRTEAAKVRS